MDMTGNTGSEGIFMSSLNEVDGVDIYEIDPTVFKQLQENVKGLPQEM